MDGWCILLHYPRMNSIPTFALYGETAPQQQEWLHWETIQARSRLHDYTIAPHRHGQFFQMLRLTAGSGMLDMDGAHFSLAPGAVAVVPALTVHGYRFTPDVDGIVVTLMQRDLEALGCKLPGAGVIPREDHAIAGALERLIAEADAPGAQHDIAMSAQLALLLVALGRAEESTAATGEHSDRARTLADQFTALVERDFRRTRRVADYAAAMGISQPHLSRICRQILGAAPLQLIERRIALEARRQLLFSSLPIKQIGIELGYDDPAYFTRFATRVLGCAPARFRQRLRRS
jgi:AraC family transcriptional activator of pobA